jgi:hypothetical protein
VALRNQDSGPLHAWFRQYTCTMQKPTSTHVVHWDSLLDYTEDSQPVAFGKSSESWESVLTPIISHSQCLEIKEVLQLRLYQILLCWILWSVHQMEMMPLTLGFKPLSVEEEWWWMVETVAGPLSTPRLVYHLNCPSMMKPFNLYPSYLLLHLFNYHFIQHDAKL